MRLLWGGMLVSAVEYAVECVNAIYNESSDARACKTEFMKHEFLSFLKPQTVEVCNAVVSSV